MVQGGATDTAIPSRASLQHGHAPAAATWRSPAATGVEMRSGSRSSSSGRIGSSLAGAPSVSTALRDAFAGRAFSFPAQHPAALAAKGPRPPSPRAARGPGRSFRPMLGLTQLSNYLTLKGSFSAESKPNFANKRV